MTNLILRTIPGQGIESICEIGGADGIVLNTVGQILNVSNLTNYDISSSFCLAGRAKFPGIRFINTQFASPPNKSSIPTCFDLIILSDITEHVHDEKALLQNVRDNCRYVVLKMPIEKCLFDTQVTYWIKGTKRPEHLRYGLAHYDGHLRGYTIRTALQTVSNAFSILDHEISDVTYFYPRKKSLFAKRVLGSRITVSLFGGTLFILATPK